VPLQTNGIYPCLVIPKPGQPLVPGHPNISSRVVGSLPIWRCPKIVVPPNLPKLDHFSIETLGDLGMLDFKNKQPLPSRQSDGLPCFPTMALATSSDTFVGPDVDSQTAKNRE